MNRDIRLSGTSKDFRDDIAPLDNPPEEQDIRDAASFGTDNQPGESSEAAVQDYYAVLNVARDVRGIFTRQSVVGILTFR